MILDETHEGSLGGLLEVQGQPALEGADPQYMREAVRMAQESAMGGGGPFGAIVVLGDREVGRGVNRVTASHDPTAHAEVQAIREACRNLGVHSLQGASLYTSCLPCPMCLAACYWAGIEKIFYSASTEQAARAGFDDAFIYRELQLEVGLRSIPLVPLMPELGSLPFESWRANPTRVEY